MEIVASLIFSIQSKRFGKCARMNVNLNVNFLLCCLKCTKKIPHKHTAQEDEENPAD